MRKRVIGGIVSITLCLLCSSVLAANEWTWLTDYQAIGIGTTGAWTDCDISSYVPSGTNAVAIAQFNTDASNALIYGARENGSSTELKGTAQPLHYAHAIIGVDSNRVIELYQGSSAIDSYIVGYTDIDHQFTNGTDKTSSFAWASYADVDVSAILPSGSSGAQVTMVDARAWVRKNGSTDGVSGWTNNPRYGVMGWPVAVDGSRIFEGGRVGSSQLVTGYWGSEAVLFENPEGAGLATIAGNNAWYDCDVSSFVPAGATGILLAVRAYSAGSSYKVGVRAKGSSDDFSSYSLVAPDGMTIAFVKLDSNRVFQSYRQYHTGVGYILGYTVSPGVPISSTMQFQGVSMQGISVK